METLCFSIKEILYHDLYIYEIFNLPVPHGNASAQYKINNKHIGVTYDEMQVVVITE